MCPIIVVGQPETNVCPIVVIGQLNAFFFWANHLKLPLSGANLQGQTHFPTTVALTSSKITALASSKITALASSKI
jgi:hypothetical protein